MSTSLDSFLATIDKASLNSAFVDLGLSSVDDVSECEATDLVGDLGISEKDASLIVEKAKETVLFDTRKALIQGTWKAVEDSLDVKATKLFYTHLFKEHPEAKPLFGDVDMDAQSDKLYKTLQVAVKFLDDIDELIPVLQEMGEKHALDYGTIAAHYDLVGESLLWTLKTGLGDAWTPEVADAWTWVYGVIAKTMSDAGDGVLKSSKAKDTALFDTRKEHIRGTWKAVEDSLATDATKLFYAHLFEEHPEAKSLFKDVDMDSQSEKLYTTLQTAVKFLDDVEGLIPVLEEMGAKHALDYGTIPAHYDLVGESLLWTLKTGLGDAWTPEVADAWTWVYGVIAKTMADAGDAALQAKEEDGGRVAVSDKSIGIGTLPDVELTLSDEEKKQIVKDSWAKVEPIAEHATKIFYKMLREKDEEANKLFESVDMDAQEHKLAATLQVAVKNLDDLDSLIPVLEDMAVRHVEFGVKERMYGTVGECLLKTLETGLGDGWSKDVKESWTWVYGIMADVMTKAAYHS